MSIRLEFDSPDKLKRTMDKTWNDFRNSLAIGKYSFNQPELALQDTFLRVFDDLIHDVEVRGLYTVTIEKLILTGTSFCRGAKLNPTEHVTHDRFIPKEEYVKDDNRFSPKGYEWLYLAMQGNMPLTNELYKPMEMCCIRECRIKDWDRVGLCSFKLDSLYKNNEIIDLTIGDKYTLDSLNKDLERFCQEYEQAAVNDYLYRGISLNTNIEKFEVKFKRWAAYTYASIMSEQLFIPLETDNKELMYSPFQCLAQYLITQGFHGIIYKSTVYDGGKNIVLFDKSYASPIGSIKDCIFHNVV